MPLYNPCLCSGSIKHVHRECLIRWIKEGRQNKKWCELCGYEFEFAAPSALANGEAALDEAANEESIWAFWQDVWNWTMIALGALIVGVPNIVLLWAVYPVNLLSQIFCSASLFPHLLLKALFVVEFMYSVYFEWVDQHRHERSFVNMISLSANGRSVKERMLNLATVALLISISVHFGLVFPFFFGVFLKGSALNIFRGFTNSSSSDVDAVFVGQAGMFSLYTSLRLALQFLNFGYRIVGFIESLCFFKIALMIFFCFYASFGFIADIISFPLSNGSIAGRFFSGTSNPLSVGILYFLIGSEIIHFMSNPMVISHFRKGVLFFRPLSQNGSFSMANIYSVPFLLGYIYVFSAAIRKFFPQYGPVKFLSCADTFSLMECVNEITFMILLRKVRIGNYKPFSTTLFTKFSSWSVKRLAALFRLSSYLYGGRFPNEERGIEGKFCWTPKRNEFYQRDQLLARKNTPVTFLDMKIKKILLLQEASLHSEQVSTAGSPIDRSPPNIHASYDICFIPQNFSVRLYSFCFACLSVVMVLFSVFLVGSIGIGWRLIEKVSFVYPSDFFAYFFGRAVVKVAMIPIYWALNRKKTAFPDVAPTVAFAFIGIVVPSVFFRFLSPLNPFVLPESVAKAEAISVSFHQLLCSFTFLSCFLTSSLFKETTKMLRRESFNTLPFVKFILKILASALGKLICSIVQPAEIGLLCYALTFKAILIGIQSWHSVKNANKEASKEQIENLDLVNYSDPLHLLANSSFTEHLKQD